MKISNNIVLTMSIRRVGQIMTLKLSDSFSHE